MDLFDSFVKYDNNQKFKKNLVFLTRHGHTFKDQRIDVKKFDKQANKNVSTINKLTNLNKNDYNSKYITLSDNTKIGVDLIKDLIKYFQLEFKNKYRYNYRRWTLEENIGEEEICKGGVDVLGDVIMNKIIYKIIRLLNIIKIIIFYIKIINYKIKMT